MPTTSRMNRASAGGNVFNVSGNATTDTDVSVGGSSTTLLAANTNRRYIGVVNTGSSDIRIRFNQAATTGTGIQLKASGGAIVFDRVVPTGALNAISESGTNTVSVTEY